jgi:hypothetical protein
MSEVLKAEVVGVDGNWILVKLPRKRKIRRMIALEFDDGDAIMLQGDNTIIKIFLTEESEDGFKAIYNDKGEYFLHLNPIMGAKEVIVPKEFVEKVKEVMFREGDLVGVFQSDIGPTRIYYGGGRTI